MKKEFLYEFFSKKTLKENMEIGYGKKGTFFCYNSMTNLHRGGLCTAEEGFCALAESGGDLDIAAEKLHSKPYREEMALASRACELQKYVSTKRKKKQKKKKGRKSIAADASDDHDEHEGSDIEPRRSRQRRPPRTTPPPGYGL